MKILIVSILASVAALVIAYGASLRAAEPQAAHVAGFAKFDDERNVVIVRVGSECQAVYELRRRHAAAAHAVTSWPVKCQ
jgi:hypothetical protein